MDTLEAVFSDESMGQAYDAAQSDETAPDPKPAAEPTLADALDPQPSVEDNEDTDADAPETDAPDPTDPTDQASGDAGEPDQSQPLAAPPRWSAADKAEFDALPREAQNVVLKRERDVERYLTQETQSLAETRRQHEALTATLEPRRHALSAQFGSMERGVETLFSISDYADRDPAGFIQWFAGQRGIDLGQQPAGEASSDEYADPEIQKLTQHLRAMEGRIVQAEDQRAEEAQAAQQSEISGFAGEVAEDGSTPLHPHFETVRPQMAALLRSGAASTLKHAYEMAVWSHAETRTTMLEQKAQVDEAKRIADAKAAAKAAKKAAGTQLSTRGGTDVKPAKRSMDETMSDAYDRATGAG